MEDLFEVLAQEADIYADNMSETNGSNEDLLIYGLTHTYDVIISEALDYVIKLGMVDNFKNEIIDIAKNSESYIVVGRLILCKALSNDAELRQILNGIAYDMGDSYFEAWQASADYIALSEDEALVRLRDLTVSTDRTVASLAHSLLAYLNERI